MNVRDSEHIARPTRAGSTLVELRQQRVTAAHLLTALRIPADETSSDAGRTLVRGVYWLLASSS